MGSISMVHWAVVLLIVVLVFGTKKLGNVGSDLGKAVKGFKDGMKGDESPTGHEAVDTLQRPSSVPIHIFSSPVDRTEHS